MVGLGLGVWMLPYRGDSLSRIIASLFGNHELGAFYDLSQCFTDTAGTTPATWGDQIARINDQTENGLNIVEETVPSRPLLGRAPIDRRNLLIWTEDFSNAVWQKIGIAPTSPPVVTANAALAPDGTMTADRVVFPASVSGGQAIIRQAVALTTNPTTLAPDVYLRADEPTIIFLRRGNGGSLQSISVTTEWQRLEANIGSFVGTSFVFDIAPKPLLADTSAEKTVFVWGASLATTRAPYQRVNSAVDMTEAGVPSFPFVRLDGIDDRLPTVIPAGGTFDVALFGRRGSWIERDVVISPGGTLTIGPASFHSAPAGILAAIGDLAAPPVFIDRTITETELARMLGYHRARGAKGFLTPGPELVVNGGFDTDLSGWNALTGWWVWSAGRAYHPLTANYRELSQTIPTQSGPVIIQFDAEVLTASNTAQWFYVNAAGVARTAALGAMPLLPSGASNVRFVAMDGIQRIGFARNTTAEFYIDNVSVRELRPSEDW